jgi:hypothetical protein
LSRSVRWITAVIHELLAVRVSANSALCTIIAHAYSALESDHAFKGLSGLPHSHEPELRPAQDLPAISGKALQRRARCPMEIEGYHRWPQKVHPFPARSCSAAWLRPVTALLMCPASQDRHNQQSRSDRSTQLCLRAREPVEDCTADLAMGAKGMKNGASRVGCPGRVGLGGGGLRRRGADRKTFGRLDCC